jgi:hypothetical protein
MRAAAGVSEPGSSPRSNPQNPEEQEWTMSTFFQNPEPVDEFDRITSRVPMVSAWEAMFSEAEEMLRETCPDGFDVLDIGRAAFDSLPESEKEGALDTLFYTYWEARQHDLEARAQYEAGEPR